MPTIEIVKREKKGYNVVVGSKFAQFAYNLDQANGIKWLIEQVASR